jgi:hypothetical protein
VSQDEKTKDEDKTKVKTKGHILTNCHSSQILTYNILPTLCRSSGTLFRPTRPVLNRLMSIATLECYMLRCDPNGSYEWQL